MITIRIGDAATSQCEETHKFDNRVGAEVFLDKRVPGLNANQMNEIFTSPDTQFQISQFRSYPEENAALMMMVRYEITVTDKENETYE